MKARPSPRRADERAPESDADLMRRIASGNLAALGALYDRHADAMQDFVERATARSADADDIVHDLFLTVTEVAGSYDGRASARPFLLGIAAQMVRRRRSRFARIYRLLARFHEGSPERVDRTPEDAARDAEDLSFVDEALAGLSEEKRLVILMIEREGLSCDEVASALHIPVGTVWTRLHHARAELRRALARRRTR